MIENALGRTDAARADLTTALTINPHFSPQLAPIATADCLLHQTDQPDDAFAGGAAAEPVAQLRFLAYYTAAGRLPFCDGAPATNTDRAWARLYVDLTDNPTNISSVLG